MTVEMEEKMILIQNEEMMIKLMGSWLENMMKNEVAKKTKQLTSTKIKKCTLEWKRTVPGSVTIVFT